MAGPDLSVFERNRGFSDYQRLNDEFMQRKALQQAQVQQAQASAFKAMQPETITPYQAATLELQREKMNQPQTITPYQAATLELQREKMNQPQGQDQNLPAAMQIANEYAKARQAGDTQRMNDIELFTKALDKGFMTNQQGQIAPMPGYTEGVGAISSAKEGGKITGKSTAEKATSLPQSNENATYMVNLLGQLKTHKGKSDLVGAKNLFSGAITSYNPFASVDPVTGVAVPVAGTDAANFNELLKQVKGKQFLEAFESLKGGGQITEVEGAKATQAISRMSAAQDEVEFDKALAELSDVVTRGYERQKQAAKGNYAPALPAGGGIKFLGFE